MPFAIIQMPGEPIVLVRIEVPLEQHIASAASVNAQLAQLASASSGDIYILIDMRGQAPTFSDILIGIQLLNQPESWLEQRSARPVLVGTDPMLRIAIKRFKQQLGLDLVHFETMDEALVYARAEIAKSNRRDNE